MRLEISETVIFDLSQFGITKKEKVREFLSWEKENFTYAAENIFSRKINTYILNPFYANNILELICSETVILDLS